MKTVLITIICLSMLVCPAISEAVLNNPVNEDLIIIPAAALQEYENNRSAGSNERDKAAEDKNAPDENIVQCNLQEVDLLARLVHAEAKGEPYKGKVAVAATVINRVESSAYPDSIREVIYQYNHGFQYCPVRNGQINLPADDIALKAAKEALQGNDPTGGAVSFYNPAKATNLWIRNRQYCTTIGNHIFVK
ncbi:MAG: cell wall hydrolase [Dethiobacteria bacterium]|jgi:N-acetylmuramoyl-L-alanine amidase